MPKFEYPFISAMEITGAAEARTVISPTGSVEQISAGSYARRINIGGPAVENYEADIAQNASALDGMDRAMPANDFYLDFCAANFGNNVARQAADILTAADGFTTAFTKEREYAGSSCWGNLLPVRGNGIDRARYLAAIRDTIFDAPKSSRKTVKASNLNRQTIGIPQPGHEPVPFVEGFLKPAGYACCPTTVVKSR